MLNDGYKKTIKNARQEKQEDQMLSNDLRHIISDLKRKCVKLKMVCLEPVPDIELKGKIKS